MRENFTHADLCGGPPTTAIPAAIAVLLRRDQGDAFLWLPALDRTNRTPFVNHAPNFSNRPA